MVRPKSTRRRHVGMIVPALGAVVLFAACAKDLAPQLVRTSHDIEGEWTAPQTFPGNQFIMLLQESSGAVIGSGNFAGEAGPFGVLVVSGRATADSVQLQIVFNYDARFTGLHPDTAQFSGAFVTLDSLSGTLSRGGEVSAAQYTRLRIGDPAP